MEDNHRSNERLSRRRLLGHAAAMANNEVAFEIEGEGRLIGLDNGDMRSQEDYRGRTRRAYNGMCLAIVQSTARAGKIRVTAAAPGLQPASLIVTTAA